MQRGKWTLERDQQLAMLYAAGWAVTRIADDLSVAVSCVRTRVSTLGLLRRRTNANPEATDNMAWVVRSALRSVIPVAPDDFAAELLAKLDDVAPQTVRAASDR